MTSTPIPGSPDELTVEWLTSALATTSNVWPSIAEVEVEAVGTGQTASTYRLSATFAAPDSHSSHTFVVKLPSQDPAVRERVAWGYETEVGFYSDIAHTVRVPMPTCHHSAIADDGASFVLLMSDLAPSVQGDQIAGCSPGAARSAVTALAGLHGPRWCDPAWSDVAATGLRTADRESADFLGEISRIAADKFLEGLGPRLTEACAAMLSTFPDLVADWLLLVPDRFSLLHGDYRLDNLMFAPDGERVHVVDWQTLTIGLPARDLAYFTATSLTPGDRREHERDLVASYHAALEAEGVAGYDLDTCFEDYRIGMLQVPMLSTLGWAFSASTDRGDEMMVTMVERATVAIEDLGTLELVRDRIRESV